MGRRASRGLSGRTARAVLQRASPTEISSGQHRDVPIAQATVLPARRTYLVLRARLLYPDLKAQAIILT